MTLFKKIAVAGISAAVLAGSLMPAEAMPVPVAPAAGIEAKSDVVAVQYRRRHGGGWYHGHRGYRDYRPGHRHHNGYWFPLAAFGAGALIGGAIASQPRYVEPVPRYVEPAPRYVEAAPAGDINPRHYEWCSDRYRSYDAYSNTFQPNYGPRQQCYSPYY
ncbi:BA14K family protein [Rhizobium terrae]|uniref:BA14K family protein n=1 Tax=Rhizobium terrae TaxID=2171756 RepID=UPI000E3CA313|nr:BA14K family protein [Rhizobium terrae]